MYLALDENELEIVKEAILHLANHAKETRPVVFALASRIKGERYPKFADPRLNTY